jgi:maleate isomerase
MNTQNVFIGNITPSGNTVVERITLAILREFPEVSPHFSRTSVFGASDPFPMTYDVEDMMCAARLLAHAKPDVLLWNGSKGAKIGIQQDLDFVAKVEAETGIRTTTSILGMVDALNARGIKRVAIVSPYDSHYQEKLVAGVAAAGYEVVAERHAALSDNISFAAIPAATIAEMVRDVASHKPEAILTLCTNFPAAPVIPALEEELDVLILDSVSMGVWQSLRMAGIDTSRASAWGRVFAEA